MSTLTRAIEKTTKGFLRSYIDASQTKDIHILSNYLADGCVRYLGPSYFLRSMGLPEDFSMTPAEYEGEFGTMEFYVFDTHEIFDLTIDTINMKAALMSELSGTFNDGKNFSRMFAWFLDFNEDASKIIKVYQQNDTQEAADFRLSIKAYHAAKIKASTSA